MEVTRSFMDSCSDLRLLARIGDEERLRQFLGSDANSRDCDLRDGRGWAALHEAAFARNVGCVRAILDLGESVDVDAVARDGVTPLILAANAGHVGVIGALLEAGADPNKATEDSMRPLQAAIKKEGAESLAAVQTLLRGGADPNGPYWNGWRPLHEAASKESPPIIRELLDAGADPKLQEDEGLSPIFVAALYGQEPCVQAIVEGRPDAKELVNMASNEGVTPLSAAAQKGADGCVRTLLEFGAEVNRLANDDVHPITGPAQRNYTRCLQLLLPLCDRRFIAEAAVDPVFYCAETPSPEALRLLLNAGLPCDRRTEFVSDVRPTMSAYLEPLLTRTQSTPLGRAVSKGHVENVQILLAAGTDAATFNPLNLAIMKRTSTVMLDAFLDHGTDLNSASEGGLVAAPDALLLSLHPIYHLKLLRMLKAGLKPSLAAWCCCKSGEDYSLLEELSGAMENETLVDVTRLLLHFAAALPNCCHRWRKALGPRGVALIEERAENPATLKHLSRLVVRSRVPSAELHKGSEWVAKLGLPPRLTAYMAYGGAEFAVH